MSESLLGIRHQRVQRLRRLLRQRSARRADGSFAVEGTKLLEAAIAAGATVEACYYAPEARDSPADWALLERAHGAGVRRFPLQRGVLERVADAASPQPVVAVVRAVDRPLGDLLERAAAAAPAPLVVCVDVRDPGNLGAIIRSADASGAAGVACSASCADPYNPKTVRASAGSLFHVPLACDLEVAALLDALGAAGFETAGTVAGGGEDYALAELSPRCALLLGNEANGLDGTLLRGLDRRLTIPMAGRAESLNVAMAATVLCFELARRRRAAPGGGAGRGAGGSPAGEPLR